jgi:branched-subunit amino acid transport protein
MSSFDIWIVMLGGMLVTYGTRLSFVMFVPPEKMPEQLQRALHYVPVAVLSAIVAPALVCPSGTLDISFKNPQLWAGLVACIVAWRLRNTWLTIGIGLIVLWILSMG